MDSKVIDIKEKLIEKNKRKNYKKHLKINRAKDMGKRLIDLCEGDFAIVFNRKSAESVFDGVTEDFVVAMSDIEKRRLEHPESFFRNFGCSRLYFNLDQIRSDYI